MALNTDMALEAFEDARRAGELEGVVSRERFDEASGFCITETEIKTVAAAKKLGKPAGLYVTLVCGEQLNTYTPLFSERIEAVSRELCKVCGDISRVLFAGLGNRSMTADCIGPLAADRVLATRHLKGLPVDTSGMSETAVLTTGVTAQTGIESAEIAAAVCAVTEPTQVIVCDALACADPSHMGRSIQLCSTGISPGSGVENSRRELSESTLGVRVAAIGVPTVSRLPDSDMLITPKSADGLSRSAAALIASAVNRLLYPGYTDEEIKSIIK